MAEALTCPSEMLAISATKSYALQKKAQGTSWKAGPLFQLLWLSCFPRVMQMSPQCPWFSKGCMHTQQGTCAALSLGVFLLLLVSVSFCLNFESCLLTLLVKTGLCFSSLGCAGLAQVVKRSKLSSFRNINTLLANNNYSTWGVFLLSTDASEGVVVLVKGYASSW